MLRSIQRRHVFRSRRWACLIRMDETSQRSHSLFDRPDTPYNVPRCLPRLRVGDPAWRMVLVVRGLAGRATFALLADLTWARAAIGRGIVACLSGDPIATCCRF